jgi:hypothetical protein
MVTGSRGWASRDVMRAALLDAKEDATARGQRVIVIHGAARGADALAEDVAEELGLDVMRFPAEWERFGRRAGYIRNIEMLEQAKPEVVLAFPLPGSVGTWHAVGEAYRRALPIRVFRTDGSSSEYTGARDD